MASRTSYWILLTAPHITETYIPLEGDQWNYEISPNKNLKKGDTVFLWLNYANCLYGWGIVAETPKLKDELDSLKRRRQIVLVNRKKEFMPRITEQIMKRHRHLKKFIPTGFDDLYALSIQTVQAHHLNDFVRENGLESPDGSAPINVSFETPEPQFLIKALLSFKEVTQEGKLVEAVNIPWFEIIKLLTENPAAAYEISADRWEEIIAGAYQQAGFEEVILTPRSGDYGRDVIAVKKGIGTIRIIEQVKAYKPGHLVTANDVRALMGVLQTDGASKGILTTTSDFAPRIKSDPLITPMMPSRLELINGDKLLKRLIELSRK